MGSLRPVDLGEDDEGFAPGVTGGLVVAHGLTGVAEVGLRDGPHVPAADV